MACKTIYDPTNGRPMGIACTRGGENRFSMYGTAGPKEGDDLGPAKIQGTGQHCGTCTRRRTRKNKYGTEPFCPWVPKARANPSEGKGCLGWKGGDA